MASADDIPAAIQWHEGMLLAPQHFQQQAHRCERLFQHHLSWHSRFHFGLGRMRIDQAMLFEGTLRILDLEAILPDGLVVSYKPGDQEELQVDVRSHAEAAKAGTLLIYLAVAAERLGSAAGEGDLQRYLSVPGEPVADESSGGRPIRIPRLRPRLRLLTPPEASTRARPRRPSRKIHGATSTFRGNGWRRPASLLGRARAASSERDLGQPGERHEQPYRDGYLPRIDGGRCGRAATKSRRRWRCGPRAWAFASPKWRSRRSTGTRRAT